MFQQLVADLLEIIKRGKAAGYHKITAEILKSLGDMGIELQTKILNKAWKYNKVPEDWKVGIIMPIFKKGDIRDVKIIDASLY